MRTKNSIISSYCMEAFTGFIESIGVYHSEIAIAFFVFVVSAMIFEFIDKVLAMSMSIGIMLLLSIMNPHEMIEMIDFNTIFLLLGMMMVVEITKESRLLSLMNIQIVKLTKGDPLILFFLFTLTTFTLSTFLSNATTMMVLVPLTIGITKSMGLDPKPYLLSEIIFSDIGGALTLVGDPTNVLIGSANNFSFSDFILNLWIPIASISFVIFGVLMVKYWKSIKPIKKTLTKLFLNNLSLAKIETEFKNTHIERGFVITTAVSLFLVVLLLIFNWFDISVAYIAFFGGIAMLFLTRKHMNYHKFFANIDWHMLLFFIGLFIHIGVLEKVGALEPITHVLSGHFTSSFELSMVILWTVGLLSGFVENIPLVAMMIPVLQPLLASGTITGNPEIVWYALSLGACLGGNGSLIGSSANMIVAQTAEKMGVKITFWEYFKIGYPITVISLIVATIYIYIVTL